jgi:hypothetical protein
VVSKHFSTLHRYDHGLLEIHFFRCRLIDAGNVSVMPRDPFRWVIREELATLDFPAANAQLTETLLQVTVPAQAQSFANHHPRYV